MGNDVRDILELSPLKPSNEGGPSSSKKSSKPEKEKKPGWYTFLIVDLESL